MGQFVKLYPEMRPPVVEGVLRRGETMNVIAAAKLGKSWFAYVLALAVAMGRLWLGRFPTRQGKVLIVDNELHKETLSHRIMTVMSAMGIKAEECEPWLSLLALRGQSVDVGGLGSILQGIRPGEYSLIVVDAFYRILPDGTSENDNAQMTQVYNAIDRYGARLECAFVLIHHSSKGDQSGKSITDVGAGAASISRAADSHVILRPHEEANSVVMQAALRSWAPLQPVGLRWYYPTWTTDDNLDPTAIKGRRPPAEERKLEGDKADCETILEALKDGAITERRLRSKTGFGRSKQQRLLDLLTSQEKVDIRTVEYKGKPCEEYFAI